MADDDGRMRLGLVERLGEEEVSATFIWYWFLKVTFCAATFSLW